MGCTPNELIRTFFPIDFSTQEAGEEVRDRNHNWRPAGYPEYTEVVGRLKMECEGGNAR